MITTTRRHGAKTRFPTRAGMASAASVWKPMEPNTSLHFTMKAIWPCWLILICDRDSAWSNTNHEALWLIMFCDLYIPNMDMIRHPKNQDLLVLLSMFCPETAASLKPNMTIILGARHSCPAVCSCQRPCDTPNWLKFYTNAPIRYLTLTTHVVLPSVKPNCGEQ